MTSASMQQLGDVIAKMKADGLESVQIDSLLHYMQEIGREGLQAPDDDNARKNSLAQIQVEAYKAREAANLSAQSLNHASALEMFKATVSTGAIARKDVLLINGGASVAFLALFGHFVASKNAGAIEAFVPALVAFVCGVAAASLTSGLTYLSQWGYEEDYPHWRHKLGVCAHVGAILSWLGASAAFVGGAFMAAESFLDLS
ncbi:hypothetical protein [Xanthomonas phaseoli]|uniref:hypothetical protein n=1 Tax=Xanthomonas phaseoli TaxID=1985254 RepID=UPI0012370CC0|nr:hypothetical protein [Xanthomonas phaseoli]